MDATHKIISSAKFPMVIFRRAPVVSPRSWLSCSVANVRVILRGTIAIRFMINTKIAGLGHAETNIVMAAKLIEITCFSWKSFLPCFRKANVGLSHRAHGVSKGAGVTRAYCSVGFGLKSFLKCLDMLPFALEEGLRPD